MLRILYLLAALFWFVSCQGQQDHDVKETRFLLGTIVEFTVYGMDDKVMLNAIQQAVDVMQQVENKFTIHGSILNSVKSFNQASAGQVVELDKDVEMLLMQSLAIQKRTYGSFDPALGDLNQLWGFSSDIKPNQPQSESAIKKSLSYSNAMYLEQVGDQLWLKKKTALKLDFGAIAKGLAIDKGIEVLSAMGVEHAVINAGGDITVLGDHGGRAWKIAVRHPRSVKPLGWFDIQQGISIVTSGDYERFFLHEGKRYHHILDPNTGKPATLSASVTVTAPTAAQADALSTAMFVLGYEKGLTIIEGIEGVEAIWVDTKQRIHQSSGMKGWFNMIDGFESTH